jgi:hypothetical protein
MLFPSQYRKRFTLENGCDGVEIQYIEKRD